MMTSVSPPMQRLLKILEYKAEVRGQTVSDFLQEVGLSNSDRQNLQRGHLPLTGKLIDWFQCLELTHSEIIWVLLQQKLNAEDDPEWIFELIDKKAREIIELAKRFNVGNDSEGAGAMENPQIGICLEEAKKIKKRIQERFGNLTAKRIQEEIFKSRGISVDVLVIKAILYDSFVGRIYIFTEELEAILSWINLTRAELAEECIGCRID
jgi:hypothetical protein